MIDAAAGFTNEAGPVERAVEEAKISDEDVAGGAGQERERVFRAGHVVHDKTVGAKVFGIHFASVEAIDQQYRPRHRRHPAVRPCDAAGDRG